MSLLERARERRAQRDGASAEDKAAMDRAERLAVCKVANHILELDGEDRVVAAMVEPVFADSTGRRALYRFTYDGLHFVVGEYWHGNPGGEYLLAVQVAKVRGWPEWPPPSPQSAGNTGWAPGGYRAVHSLAQLADVVETNE